MAASVYRGARLYRENRFVSRSLAVALNAWGGPGAVLASLGPDKDYADTGVVFPW